MTTRWVFLDTVTSETWTVPMNPNAMTSPLLDHATTPGTVSPIDARHYGARRVLSAPKEWKISGLVRTQSHHDLLIYWASKTDLLHITDHYGRTFAARIRSIDMQDRKANRNVPWRLRYSINALSYGVV